MKTESITKALALGIKFIQNQQKPDGGLKNESTIFYHALILQSLSGCKTPASDKITARIRDFLIKHKSSRWSFNYWIRPDDHSPQHRYPDDWDDTACALAALAQSHKPLLGQALVWAVKNLTALETDTGGPYFTWMTTDKAGREVDLVVNANIAYFLSLHQAFPKGLHDFLQKKISKRQFHSAYYVGEGPVLYFLSRIAAKNEAKLITRLNSKLRSAETPQDVALYACALLNLGFPASKLNRYIRYLLSKQNSNGTWDTVPFGVEKIVKGKKYYSASAAFTTAVCIEALNKYGHTLKREENPEEKLFYSQTIQRVQKTIFSQPVELRRALLSGLKNLVATDSDKQIVLLPFWINQMLRPKKQLDKKTLQRLAQANVYGWIAYRIYDDFLDKQGKEEMLPAANWSLLGLSRIYLSLGITNPAVAKLFSSTLDGIEAANAWEQRYGRLAQFRNNPFLAQKSFGAALPALSVLILGQSPSSSTLYKQTRKFFWHYLSARQLNDDAHDWQADLRLGQVNSAGAGLLQQFKKRPAGLPEDFPTPPKLFWHKTMPVVIKKIENHLRQARINLKRIPASKYKNRFQNMLMPLEQATSTAYKRRKQTLEFLTHYTNTVRY